MISHPMLESTDHSIKPIRQTEHHEYSRPYCMFKGILLLCLLGCGEGSRQDNRLDSIRADKVSSDKTDGMDSEFAIVAAPYVQVVPSEKVLFVTAIPAKHTPRISANDLSNVVNGKSITRVLATGVDLDQSAIEYISRIEGLTEIIAQSAKLSQSDFARISTIKSLQSLNVLSSDVSNAELTLLSRCKDLKYLILTETVSNRTGIEELKRKLPALSVEAVPAQRR